MEKKKFCEIKHFTAVIFLLLESVQAVLRSVFAKSDKRSEVLAACSC